jgi:hypothetical protein
LLTQAMTDATSHPPISTGDRSTSPLDPTVLLALLAEGMDDTPPWSRFLD